MQHVPAECVRLFYRASWLIKIRWVAIVGVTIATFISQFFLKLLIQYTELYFLAGMLFIFNTFYFFLTKSFKLVLLQNQLIKKLINLQITFDFIFLTTLLHFSGGIENPFIVFYIFHMLIASISLSKIDSYIQTTIAILLFSLLTYLELTNILPHHCINKNISNAIENDVGYLIAAFGVFIITSYFSVYIMTTISGQLRKQQAAYSQANKELRKKDKIKDEYVQRVTHDIKGHIAVISSSLEILKRKSLGEIHENYDDVIKRGVRRTDTLLDFIKELLTITNLRLKNKMEIKPFLINEVINKSIEATIGLAKDKNILIHSYAPNDLGEITGEQFSIEEAITNLLQNAVKYTPQDGKISLMASSDEKDVTIEIIDTGVGIPEEDIDKVFDEFYRSSNVKKSIEGSGLGLALVKQIIQRQKGKISVKSKVGEGSTFTVILPRKIE